jgi:hypothetical protein
MIGHPFLKSRLKIYLAEVVDVKRKGYSQGTSIGLLHQVIVQVGILALLSVDQDLIFLDHPFVFLNIFNTIARHQLNHYKENQQYFIEE